MVERREDVRFALESRDALGISRKELRKNFDGDLAIQSCIPRAIHLAHAPGAEGAQHFVWPDSQLHYSMTCVQVKSQIPQPLALFF